MKKLLLLVPILYNFYSCSPVYKLKGDYPEMNSYHVETTDSYDQVWNKIIDFFAMSEIPISTIDKEDGLIISSNFSFMNNYTKEYKGKPEDPNAYVVIAGGLMNLDMQARLFGALSGNPLDEYGIREIRLAITGDFNVRIKKIDENLVSVNVNLMHLICLYNGMKTPIKSTGVFEKSLIAMFKPE